MSGGSDGFAICKTFIDKVVWHADREQTNDSAHLTRSELATEQAVFRGQGARGLISVSDVSRYRKLTW